MRGFVLERNVRPSRDPASPGVGVPPRASMPFTYSDQATAQVHLWRIRAPADWAPAMLEVLDYAERVRAGRLRDPAHRTRFLFHHVAVRRILASYLDQRPEDLVFAAGAHGKPRLAAGAAQRLAFNLSHADALAVLAVARDVELGVDIEGQASGQRHATLARRGLSPSERARFGALLPRDRASAFLRCWTRKEAYLKATGDGLSIPLTDISVSLDADATLIAVDTRPGACDGWSLHNLAPAPGFVGALAVAAPNVALRWFDFAPDALLRPEPLSDRDAHHG
jgi:4'-phosphopantetheinyl transferase